MVVTPDNVYIRSTPEAGGLPDASDFTREGDRRQTAAEVVWTHARPSAAMLAAYEDDPSWPRTGWTSPSLQETLTTLIAGTLNRAPLNPERRSSAQLPLEQTCV